MYPAHYSNYWATMSPGSLSELDREQSTNTIGMPSYTHRLIASLYPEMEEQHLYLHAATMTSWLWGYVQRGRRRTLAEWRGDISGVLDVLFWGVA